MALIRLKYILTIECRNSTLNLVFYKTISLNYIQVEILYLMLIIIINFEILKNSLSKNKIHLILYLLILSHIHKFKTDRYEF